MTYNMDEHLGDNHYNCPVVAYYPEVHRAPTCPPCAEMRFHLPIIWASHHRKEFPQEADRHFAAAFPGYHRTERFAARCEAAYAAYDAYHRTTFAQKGEEMIELGAPGKRPPHHRAGRPARIMSIPEINHGIDKLIAGFGAAVVTEDCPLPGTCRSRRRACSTSGPITPGCTPPRATSPPQRDMNLVQLGLLRLRRGRNHHRRGARDSGSQG